MNDVITQIRGLAAYAAKALIAAATLSLSVFATDALDILAGTAETIAETIFAAVLTAVAVYLVPNKATPTG